VNQGEQDRLRQKYQKKGWSEAKIARAMEDKEAAKSAGIGRNSEMGPERRFREAITAQVRRFNNVRLFAHLYKGSLDDEVVTSEGQREIDLFQFLESGFPAEKLVEIVERTG
jgi:hypothetical protein